MEGWIVGVIIVVAFVFFIWWVKFRERRAEWMHEAIDNLNGLGISNTFTRFKQDYTTPQGARVKSTVPVPATALERCEAGLQQQIDRLSAMFPAWTLYKNISDYDIFFIDPMGENVETEPGSPHIRVGGWTSAGTVLGCHDRFEAIKIRPIIVVPHQQNQNWRFLDYLQASIHNESEHARGWINKHLEPTGVFFHFLGANDAHPWQWGESRGLVSSQTKHHCMPDEKKV